MFTAKHRTGWTYQQVLIAGTLTAAALVLLTWLYYNHWFTAPAINYLKAVLGVK